MSRDGKPLRVVHCPVNTAGVPWQKAALMPQFNAYHGIMPDSFCVFQNLGDMPLDVDSAVIYESKFRDRQRRSPPVSAPSPIR